ncbi:carboxylate-amine ligase [Pseudomonas sp. H9]|uniref:carboxylate-amine ligase n=1 Tax=Pseudomonas sp. H9 TaxID=483968 RepID=UPI00105805B9|nr:carboxylate-amine ligase [Pseudomonas sp. H9]TDF83930.1 carboxylate-amine ligase [Pseudomonas sp. H9]
MKPGFGIEEEFLLVDLYSRQVVAEPGTAAIELCREVFGAHFAQEMFKSQIELASPVFSELEHARNFLRSKRHHLAASLAQQGLGICAAGSHPLGGWQLQQCAEDDHYHHLFDDYQQVARRSLVCGLHIHVGVGPGYDRIRLINQVLPWLPLLLVLSTSSPFWEGRDTGYRSYRRVLCTEWPRMGLPQPLHDWDDYQRYLNLLQRTGSVRARSDCWWAIRPSSRYPTIELRIADGCPQLEDALCIAGMFRKMIAQIQELNASNTEDAQQMQWITQENLWRAMRYGSGGTFIEPTTQSLVSAQDWLLQLQEQFALSPRYLDHALRIVTHGTSADRQLATYHRARALGLAHGTALHYVVDELLEQTAAG